MPYKRKKLTNPAEQKTKSCPQNSSFVNQHHPVDLILRHAYVHFCEPEHPFPFRALHAHDAICLFHGGIVFHIYYILKFDYDAHFLHDQQVLYTYQTFRHLYHNHIFFYEKNPRD
jgi:hypothetical protein